MAAPKVFIDEVVRSLLIQQGIFTEHRLAQYVDIAIRGVKELNFDVAKNINELLRQIDSNTAPNDESYRNPVLKSIGL